MVGFSESCGLWRRCSCDPDSPARNVPFAKGSEEEFNFFTAGEVRTKLLTCVGAEVNWHHSWTD